MGSKKIGFSMNLREHGLPEIIMSVVEMYGTKEEIEKARSWLYDPDTMFPKTFIVVEALFEATVDPSTCKLIIKNIGKVPFLPVIKKLIIGYMDENEKEKIAGKYLRELLENEKYKENLLFYYNKWKEAKRETIQQLRKIADEMDSTRRNVNISQLTGSSVAVVGTVAVVGSIFTGGILALVAGIGGGVAAATGGVTTAGAAIAGGVLSKKAIEYSNDLLKKQQQTTDTLIKELDKYKEKNKSYLKTASNFGEVVLRFKKINEEKVEINIGIGDCMEKKVGCDIKGIVKSMFKLSTTLVTISGIVPVVARAITPSTSLGRTALSFTDDACRVISTGAKAASVLFGAALVVIDVATIVETSIDVSKGSKDQAAKLIREVADKLERRALPELDDLIITAQLEAAKDCEIKAIEI